MGLIFKHLKNEGWNRSHIEQKPVDGKGEVLPWYTYGAIHFITPRLKKEFKVLEYGSGNSTFWYSQRVGEVISIEHHEGWYNKVKKKLDRLPNVKIFLKSIEDDSYHKEALKYKKELDIIVIDGKVRNECSKSSIDALKDDGIIIFDNSDRIGYQEGYDFLTKNGFKRIEFRGLGPQGTSFWETSIFYRANNCLGI